MLTIAVAAVSIQGIRLGFGPIDDAYITARYAKHLAERGEISFNWGDRVEGYTNFTWLAASACLARPGITPGEGVVLLSLLSGIAGIVLIGAFARWELGFGPVASAIGAIAFSMVTPWSAWAWSGMETCGFAVLYTAGLWAYSRSRGPSGWAIGGILAALCAMTRPEGVLAAAAMVIHELLIGRRWNKLAWSLGAFLAVFGAYFVWRYQYFGYPFPNTYYAKVGRPGTELALRGWRYLWNFLAGSWPLWVLGLSLVSRKARPVFERNAMPALLIGCGLYIVCGIVLVGGDHFAMHRFCMPLLPILFLAGWVGACGIASTFWTADSAVPRYGPSIAIIVASAASSYLLTQRSVPNGNESHRMKMNEEIKLAGEWRGIGRELAIRYGRDRSIATFAIGAIGYFSKMTVWDMYGIIHPEIAHQQIKLGEGTAGHEKFDSDFILDRQPDLFLLQNLYMPNAVENRARIWGAASIDLMQNRRFQEEYRFDAFQAANGAYIHVYVRNEKGPPA
jgi:hypothetical protein